MLCVPLRECRKREKDGRDLSNPGGCFWGLGVFLSDPRYEKDDGGLPRNGQVEATNYQLIKERITYKSSIVRQDYSTILLFTFSGDRSSINKQEMRPPIPN